MGKNGIITIVIVVGILIIAYLLLRKPAQSASLVGQTEIQKPSTAMTQPASQILTRIKKNEQNTLSIVQYKSDTGEVVGSRNLSFQEAIQSVGGQASMVCSPSPVGVGANGYQECSVIRGR